MKTRMLIPIAGMLLATAGAGLSQPCITISTQPQPQTNCVGTTATFAVEATDTELLAYQWQHAFDLFNYLDLPDATNSTLVITNVQTLDSGNYRVVITNVQCSVTSEVARLWFASSPPFISSQPTNWYSVSLGASLTNRVVAGSAVPPSYQWRLNGVPIGGQTKSSIILTNLQVADGGTYDVVVANPCGSITSTGRVLYVDPTYTQITTGRIVTDTEGGYNANWIDYDQDGNLDLCVTPGSSLARMLVYHNNGDGSFTRMTTGTWPTTLVRSLATFWGDYDNDGRVDLFVPNVQNMNDMLFRNEGNGAFTRVLTGPVVTDGLDDMCGTWLDYDRDGFLDLFVSAASTQNDVLCRNNGDGTFRKLTSAEVGPILLDATFTEFAVAVDMDNDGWPEISRNLAANGTGGGNWRNQLWHYNGVGQFALMDIGEMGSPGVGYCNLLWADYDNDGFQDATMGAQNSGFRLYHNLAGQGFTNVTASAGLSSLISSYNQWFDYDNDGWQDILIATDPGPTFRLFRNNGDGTFTERDIGGPLPRAWGPFWGDYNNDGFLDLFRTYGPGIRNALFQHNSNSNHWLKVKLDGRASNRSGIGAKVRAQATIQGRTFWQVREVSQEGICFDHGLIAHFGLGDATIVEALRIEWPSGIVQTLTNVTANQMFTVYEHQEYGGPPPALGVPTLLPNGLQLSITEPDAGAVYVLAASTDLVNWTKLMARTSAGGTFSYTDTRTASYPRRFYRVVVP